MYENIQALIKNEEHKEAICELEKLLKSYPDFALACNDLGVLCYREGNMEKAGDYYHKAIRLEPENIIFQKESRKNGL